MNTVIRVVTTGPQGPAGTGADLSYNASTRLLSSSSGADVTLPEATTSVPGLMAASDKVTLSNAATIALSAGLSIALG